MGKPRGSHPQKGLLWIFQMMPLCVHHSSQGPGSTLLSPVSFLEPLQSQDQQLASCYRTRMGETHGFPANAQLWHIHCHRLCCDVWTILQGGYESQLPTAASSHQGQARSQLSAVCPPTRPPCPLAQPIPSNPR